MRRLSLTMMVIALLLGANQFAPAQIPSDLVLPSLLADVSQIKPGEPFTVGVLLKLKPGWHVYWSNPGDSGLPTRVQWTLPDGYTASDLRFPVPEHIDLPGGIVIYGYTDEVLLTSTITPPANASNPANISAKVNWLCCSENCTPGKTTLNLQLPIGEKSVPDNNDVFAEWQNRWPTRGPTPAPSLNLSDAAPSTEIVTPRKITDPKAIIPGAVDGLILTIGAPQPTDSGTTIPVSAQVLKGQTVTAKSVPILLTWSAPDGSARLGEEITIPIVSGR